MGYTILRFNRCRLLVHPTSVVLSSLRLWLAVLAGEPQRLIGHEVTANRVDGGSDGEGDDNAWVTVVQLTYRHASGSD